MPPADPRSILPWCASVAVLQALTGGWSGIVTEQFSLNQPKMTKPKSSLAKSNRAKSNRASRRFLALWFPFLSTDRLIQAQPVTPLSLRAGAQGNGGGAVATVEKQRGAMRLVSVDPQAAAAGLGAGLALADAQARMPDLQVVPHDHAADLHWLERLADGCDRYTPLIELDPPDGVTLDITGCAHLFDGEAALIADIERRLTPFVHLRLAVAGTPTAAQALARFQTVPAADEAQAIRRLPIAAVRLDEETQTSLRRAGLKTIGDLAARPTAPLAARFGEDAVAMLARLLGHTDSRLVPRKAPPALLFERRFAEPIVRTQDAMKTIGDLASEAARAMEERGKGGRRFAVRLFRSDGELRDLAVESGLPLRDPVAVMRLFGERLDTLADPIDPGFGFDLIRLVVPVLETMAPIQLQLEGGTISDDALSALVDRLSTRLGRGAIRRFARRDTHIPEQGVLALPAIEPAISAWDAPTEGEPPLRPLHLFDPPQRIDVIAEVPDGPPHRFRWRRSVHDIIRFEGPERIASEWWRRHQGSGLTRDYYRVEDARGRRFWIFRHGLYDREKPDPGWYVHGLFA